MHRASEKNILGNNRTNGKNIIRILMKQNMNRKIARR